jgi:plastocyanin
MNKTIITIIIVAVVLVGGYFLFKGTSQLTLSVPETLSDEEAKETKKESTLEQSNQQPSSQSSVVTYTDTGYAPATLQIKKGETVVFKNQSSQSMWIASAFHPTHTAYPTTGGCLGSTFDACKGVQPNENWSFKFDISGTWKYHNHLSPGDIGTIIVQ